MSYCCPKFQIVCETPDGKEHIKYAPFMPDPLLNLLSTNAQIKTINIFFDSQFETNMVKHIDLKSITFGEISYLNYLWFELEGTKKSKAINFCHYCRKNKIKLSAQGMCLLLHQIVYEQKIGESYEATA